MYEDGNYHDAELDAMQDDPIIQHDIRTGDYVQPKLGYFPYHGPHVTSLLIEAVKIGKMKKLFFLFFQFFICVNIFLFFSFLLLLLLLLLLYTLTMMMMCFFFLRCIDFSLQVITKESWYVYSLLYYFQNNIFFKFSNIYI